MHPIQEAVSARFEDAFGAEALASVQQADGRLDLSKVKEVFQDHGITGVSSSAAPGALGLMPTHSGEFNAEAALDRFASRFGEDAAASIANADGSIDFAKMGEFIQSHRNGAAPDAFQALAGTQSVAIADRISKQFGEEALAQVTDAEGNIDPGKVKDFMMEKIRSGDMRPPMGGFGPGAAADITGLAAPQHTELFDTLLSTLSAEDDAEDTVLSLYI